MSSPVSWEQRKYAGSANLLCMTSISYTIRVKVIWLPMRYHGEPESPSDRYNKGESDSDEDWEAISYPVTHTSHIPEDPIIITSQVISDVLNTFVGRVKIHNDLRERIEMVGTAYEEIGEIDPINIQTHITEVFSQVTPEQMAEYQRVDNQIGPIILWVQEGKVPPKAVLYKVKSKTCRKLYFQFDRFVIKTRGFTSVIYS